MKRDKNSRGLACVVHTFINNRSTQINKPSAATVSIQIFFDNFLKMENNLPLNIASHQKAGIYLQLLTIIKNYLA